MNTASRVHVFNQYYFDFLKKLKTLARDLKYDSKPARGLLKAIKRHYLNYDKLSDEYVNDFLVDQTAWTEYTNVSADVEDLNKWFEEHPDVRVFKDVNVSMVHAVMKDKWLMHYFMSILCAMSQPLLSDGDVSTFLFVVRNIHKKEECAAKMQDLQNDVVKNVVMRLQTHYEHRMQKESPLKGMEDTSIGKLAKEILDEVDVAELQQSFGDGDILSALANPNGGVAKLLGTVSQKMLTKMANGEIKHETLLQDAMKFATQMGGGAGGMGDMANMMGGLMKTFMGGAGGEDGMPSTSDGFDMSMLTNLMGQMGMGGGGPRGGGNRAPKRPTNAPMVSDAMRRTVQARNMRKKLEAKRTKENVSGHVEETS